MLSRGGVTTFSWEKLHDPRKGLETGLISVTNLITMLGYGYKPRRSLFLSPSAKKKESEFEEAAKNFGNANEPLCFSILCGNKEFSSRYHVLNNPSKIVKEDGRIAGTVDGFLFEKGTNKLGILEIKCPFGRKWGKWSVEDLPPSSSSSQKIHYLLDEKKLKHYLQLQLYLHLYRDFGFTYGVLAYLYKGAGYNGESTVHHCRVEYCPTLYEDLQVPAAVDLYFEYLTWDIEDIPKRYVKPRGFNMILEEEIIRGSEQTQQIREAAR